MATLLSKIAAGRAEIGELHCADIADMDMERVGLKGSPTKVNRTFVPDRSKHGVKIAGKSAEDSAVTYPCILGEGELFVLNDMRESMKDSREFGPIQEKDVDGSLALLLRRRGW